MVTQEKINALGFERIEEYFEYIVESKINGQRKQAQSLYRELSGRQQTDLLCWHEESYFPEKGKCLMIELLNYIAPY